MPDNVTIITNHQSRLLLDWNDLTPTERDDFFPSMQDSDFFLYRGNVYCLSDFMPTGGLPEEMRYWDGYANDTFFSGVLVKFVANDSDRVIVGRFFA